jgi:hypothetical protein
MIEATLAVRRGEVEAGWPQRSALGFQQFVAI